MIFTLTEFSDHWKRHPQADSALFQFDGRWPRPKNFTARVFHWTAQSRSFLVREESWQIKFEPITYIGYKVSHILTCLIFQLQMQTSFQTELLISLPESEWIRARINLKILIRFSKKSRLLRLSRIMIIPDRLQNFLKSCKACSVIFYGSSHFLITSKWNELERRNFRDGLLSNVNNHDNKYSIKVIRLKTLTRDAWQKHWL